MEAWPETPPSPPSPAKRATQDCIDCPSQQTLCDVASAASEPQYYPEVLDTLADTLMDTLTDDWRKLRNALWLVEHLLTCTPQLKDDLCAEPGMLRGLLGFWAEDEQGHDCGQEVRMRASTLLGLLETHEQTLIAQRCAQQVAQQPQQQWEQPEYWEAAQLSYAAPAPVPHWCTDDDDADSPTNSEDSTSSTCSPFSLTQENSRGAKPAKFSLPALSRFKLPKLKLKTAPVTVAAVATAASTAASGKPPRGASFKAGSLKAGSFKAGSLRHGTGSQELVQAWGQIRGQDSSDFARMLQALDDKCFEQAQEAYEALQRPSSAQRAF